MLKLKSRISRISLIAIAMTGIVPMAPVAQANELVTKTFSVRDFNNNPVQGALVRVWWSDPVKVEIVTTEPIVQTDANGLATISILKDRPFVSYQVFPPAGDTTNAIESFKSLSTTSSETLNIKFRQANLVVNVFNQDGNGGLTETVASDESLIGVPNGGGQYSADFSMVLRGGAFGLAIPSNLVSGSNYTLRLPQFVPWKVPNRFSWSFGFRASGAAGSQTYTVYTDVSYTTAITPTNAGVINLDYKAGNLSGGIKDVNGNPISIGQGVRANIVFNPDFAAPINSGSGYNLTATNSPNGNWYARMSGPAGRYNVTVAFSGSDSLISFSTKIWKNSAGGFSLSENGPFTSAPHTLDFRMPATANLKLQVKTPEVNSVALPSSINIYNASTGAYIFGTYSENGKFVAAVEDGTYRLDIFPNNPSYAQFQLNLVVANGIATLTQSGGTLTKVNDFFEPKPFAENFKFRIVSDTSTSVTLPGSDIGITKGSTGQGDFVLGRTYSGSDVSFYLADGTYTLRVNPGNANSSIFGSQSFPLVITNGVPTVSSLVADNDGVFRLPLKSKNFQFKIVQASDETTLLSNSWIDYCQVTSFTPPISYSNCRGDGTQQGLGAISLDNGSYILNVNPGSNSTDTRRAYNLVIANNVVSSFVTRIGETAVPTDGGRYKLFGAATNVRGNLKSFTSGQNIVFGNNQGIDTQLQRWNASRNNWDWIEGIWRSNSSYGFAVPLENGKYRILAKPHGFPELATTTSAEFDVTNGALVAPTGVTLSNGALTDLDISLKAPNFKIYVDTNVMKSGWISIHKRESNGNTFWIENLDMNSQSQGLGGANLADGTYRIEVNPQSGNTMLAGLARSYYDLTIENNVPTSLSLDGVPVLINQTLGRYLIKPAKANVTGQIVDQAGNPLGNANNKWVSINMQKWNTDRKSWDWTSNWGHTDSQGFFSMSASTAGKYRLRIEPNGFGDASVTYSTEFEVQAGQEDQFSITFGQIKSVVPSLKVQVVSGNSTPLNHIGIEIRRNGNWLDWASTGPFGTAAIAFAEAGTYEIVTHPAIEQVNAGATRKTYTVVATAGINGVITASVTGVAASNAGITTLTFNAASLQGFVYAPSTTTGVQNSTVVAVDINTQRELWDYSANTSPTGKWSMSLPAGSYSIYARAPWGSSTFGNSALVTGVVVDANGAVTVNGTPTSTMNFNLSQPTWTGVVKAPVSAGNAPIPYAGICLYTANVWSCTTANENGAWALSAPANFNNAFSDNAIVEFRDDRNRAYPMLRLTGPTAVLGAIGLSGASIQNLPTTNFKVLVKAGTNNATNVWVSVDAPNRGWLGGATTNASGIASFYIDTTTVTSDLNVRVDVNGNRELSSAYTSTRKTFAIADVNSANGSYQGTLDLDAPNFLGVVREPTVGGVNGSAVPWSWVELFNETNNGNWVGGSNTNEFGAFSMNIPRPASGQAAIEYTLVVNPQWNSATDSTRRQYKVMMPASGDPTITVKAGGAAVATTTVNGVPNYYALTLASPSVKGTVVNPSDVAVRDSWVVPISSTTGEYFWQQGMHTRAQGNFSLALGDGNYRIEANTPWNNSDLAKAANCNVTVLSGAITASTGGCLQSNGTLKLALRAPNVTFTLKKPNGTVVPYAWVSISLGRWNTGAQSNEQGKVSLFVDRDAILAANTDFQPGTYDLHIWVNPPYGSSEVVGWGCRTGDQKPICQTLPDFNTANEYQTVPTFEVTMATPNTKLRIVNGATGLQNAWVNLFRFEDGTPNSMVWLAGSNSDSTGYASFNIDTSTATANTRYRVEVNPPWDQRAAFSQAIYGDVTGLTWQQVNNQDFAIGTPNLKITVLTPQLVANKWGWISVEEVNSSNNFVRWVGGYGLDNNGIVALNVGADKRYKIVAHPGSGRTGTRSECIITTNSSSVVQTLDGTLCSVGSALTFTNQINAMTITLKAGNLTGTVTDLSGNPVSGAIVYANFVGATNEDAAQTVITLADGKFGFQVDTSKTWDIKIFPANTGVGTQLANKSVLGVAFTNNANSRELGTIQLSAR